MDGRPRRPGYASAGRSAHPDADQQPPSSAIAAARGRAQWWPTAVWLVALAVVAAWGWWLEATGAADLVLFNSQPFLGGLLAPEPARLLLPAAVAALAITALPHVARRLRWGWLLLACVAAGAVWAWSLSTARGWSDFLRPLYRDDDYLTALPVADIGEFLATFTDDLLGYAVHIQGHPPGPVVLLAWLDRLGLAQPWLVGGLYVVLGCSTVAAAAVAMKALAGHDGELLARRMLPAATLAPAAVWSATSPDAGFGGVLAWGVALLAVASGRRSRGRGWHSWLPPALAAGVLLGLCPFLSYGLLPMGVLVFVVPWHTRQWLVFAVVSAIVVAQAAAWALAGFWLPDGIIATREAWQLNGASIRPYWYFLVANFVVLAALVGPATLAGLPSLRALARPGAAFVAVAVAAAGAGAALGYMRGEVERIWLPLTAWLMLAAAATAGRRVWLVAQACVALTLAALINSPW